MKETKAMLEEMDCYSRRFYPRQNGELTCCDTVEDLCRCWLAQRRNTVKRSTYSSYKYYVEVHILPFLGKISLAALGEQDIETLMDGMRNQELAESSRHSVFIVFKSVLKLGIRLHLVREGLLCCCTMNYRRPESRVLTIQESAELKEYLLGQNTVFSLSVLLCRGTGMRIGELCGLKWGDIDFPSNSIRIRRTVSRIPNPDLSEGQPRTVLYIRTPKSHASAREVPIPRYLAEALQGLRGQENSYVLTGKETCTEPRNVQKKFKTILKHCGMQECNFHAMRHGFATACLESGIDCKTVSDILGHSSASVTMDIYMHTSMRQKQNCVDTIE